MTPQISPTDLSIILLEADRAAMRLRRRLGLPRAEQADLRQELLVDLIRRMAAFDRRRGSLGAFAGIVLRNRASRIALDCARERQRMGGAPLRLDARGRDGVALVERLAAPGGAPAVERRLDIVRVLSGLPPADRALCIAAASCPLRQLAARGFGSRAGLHRRVSDVRMTLAAHGLAPRWDSSAIA
jgi:RNA polymerase sigma-70 factor (ECF subfamily)